MGIASPLLQLVGLLTLAFLCFAHDVTELGSATSFSQGGRRGGRQGLRTRGSFLFSGANRAGNDELEDTELREDVGLQLDHLEQDSSGSDANSAFQTFHEAFKAGFFQGTKTGCKDLYAMATKTGSVQSMEQAHKTCANGVSNKTQTPVQKPLPNSGELSPMLARFKASNLRHGFRTSFGSPEWDSTGQGVYLPGRMLGRGKIMPVLYLFVQDDKMKWTFYTMLSLARQTTAWS